MMRKFVIFSICASLLLVIGFAVKADPKFTGIVASKAGLGLTSDFSNQTVWTPDSDSLVRITAFSDNSSHIGAVSLQISYTDLYGVGQTCGFSFNSVPTAAQCTVNVKSGNTITVTSSAISGLGAPVNAYVVVERLE